MLLCRQSDLIEVRRAEDRGRGGRGVFARVDIAADTLLERVPVILLPHNQIFGDPPHGQRSAAISWYVFDWTGMTKRDYVAVALGYGSIYNHSFSPNARYTRVAPDLIDFHAIKPIAAGEEVLINYHGEPTETRSVDFDVK